MPKRSNRSQPRLTQAERREALTLASSGRGPGLFEYLGGDTLSIYEDVAVVGSRKAIVTIPVERLAGAVYARSLPIFGRYRLTLVYVDPSDDKREFASVVMGYRNVIKALVVLRNLNDLRESEIVMRKEPYPLKEALACAGTFAILSFSIGTRSGGLTGGLILAAAVFLILASIEMTIELRRPPAPTFVGRNH
jgi:hypothetical protein